MTNHSSETSNYVIAVDVTSAAGDPLGSGSANVANLAAGATTTIQVPVHNVDQSLALGAQADAQERRPVQGALAISAGTATSG